ncbi:MAG: arginine deiminase-related protein, partial [Cyclobacteriaceae bacterium]|nr:arginine deiminase-related protein [Cyclobacteriaceae bacterium]
EDILKDIAKRNDVMLRVKTFEHFEKEGKYLEGTGSLILDRINYVAYAAISERTHPDVLTEFAKETGFRIISFTACQSYDGQRLPIYHTNVMMCLGEKFSVICADCIDDEKEKKEVLDSLQNTGKELILISEDQRDQFAGNMLQVRNKKGERFVVMSEAAYQSLDKGQIKQLEKHGKILHTPIPTIEKLGGGSVRCMMGEVFIPVK